MTLELMVAGIGRSTLILGFPWLQTWNPDVDWKRGTLAWRIETPSVANNISGTTPVATSINLISRTRTCEGLGLVCRASPVRTIASPIRRWVSLPEKAGSPLEPVNPMLQIDTLPIRVNPESKIRTEMSSINNISRAEMPQKTATPTPVSIALPEVHIQTMEEQQAQEDWVSPMFDEDDEPRFWINMLETLEETDSFPSELEVWIRSKTHKATELAIAHGKETPQEKTVEEIVLKELHDYLDVFSEKKAARFPSRKPYDHKIETKPGFKPKRHKLYSLTPEEDKALKTFVDENLAKGYIQESKSEMASSFFFIKKKTRDKCPCQDYRYLNEWTIKNLYPLPRISDLLNKLKGKSLFSAMDVRGAYNNVHIAKGHEWKAAFITSHSLFKLTVMFFGLCNSPTTFQHMMDHIFVHQLIGGWLLIYMDNILITTQ